MVTIVTREQLTEVEVVRLLTGTSIKSVEFDDADVRIVTTDRVEFTLSASSLGELTVNIANSGSRQKDFTIRLNLGEYSERLTAREVEKKINAVRQIYALSYLAERERLDLAVENLRIGGESADLEFVLLPKKDQIYIEAFSVGSWWLTLLTKSKEARDVLENLLALPIREGRDALSRRVLASVEAKELENDRVRIDNILKLVDGVANIQKKAAQLDPSSAAVVNKCLSGLLAVVRDPGQDNGKDLHSLSGYTRELEDTIGDLNRSMALGPKYPSGSSGDDATKVVSQDPTKALPDPSKSSTKTNAKKHGGKN